MALATVGTATAQGSASGLVLEQGAGLTRVQYYDRDERSSGRYEERRRYRDRNDDDDDDDDRRSRRSRRDDDERGGYGGRSNPYAQRGGNSGNVCVTSRGNCATYGQRPAASPCSCDIPGFGEKRGAVAAGGGGGGYGRGGYDGGSSSGVIVRRGY